MAFRPLEYWPDSWGRVLILTATMPVCGMQKEVQLRASTRQLVGHP